MIAFIERYLLVPEGGQVGRPVTLRPWQREIIRGIYDGDPPARRAIISFGRKNGKGLALDTPIPTPNGWRTMGDLRPGDYVFGSDGRPTRVSFVSETHTGLRCWRITFSDGSSVIADEQHRWLTRHDAGDGGPPVEAVVTTPQIAASIAVLRPDGWYEENHRIACAPALESPAVPLPVAPYALGAWLGDGPAASAAFTCDDQDLAEMVRQLATELGAPVRVARHGDRASTIRTAGPGWQVALRALGVWGDKRIPAAYLDAGTEQRWALLQGLMDTAGTVTLAGGRTMPWCSFATESEVLARDVWRLARSLGLEATIREGVAKVGGRAVGRKFAVSFTAARTEPVFRLERKRSLLPPESGSRSRTLTIVSCEEVESVPTRCIQVEAPDSLFLCGHGCVPTHNTSLAAMLLLAHLVGPEARRNGQIYSAAQSRDQAAIVFGLAAKMVRMSPTLNAMVTVRDSRKELFCEATGVLYRALSADATTAYGFSPVLVIHDELGQVRGPRSELYDALETAMGAQEAPLSIIISTQAVEDADLLSVLIDDARAGHDPRTRLFLWAAPEGAAVLDEAAWRAANPALGDFSSLEQMREAAERAARMPSFEAAFRNLNLNQRVAAAAHFLAPSVWTACAGPPDDDAFAAGPVYGGLDLSGTQDLTALVLVARDAAGVVHVRPWFWTPGRTLRDRAARDRAPYDVWAREGLLEATPGVSVDYGFVARRIAELSAACDLRAIRFDRWRVDLLRRELDAIGCGVALEPMGQGYRDMAPALDTLEQLALDGRLRHGGHAVLTWCAANAVATRDAAGNRKLDKARGTGRIDGMVALAMAVAALATAAPATEASIWDREELWAS